MKENEASKYNNVEEENNVKLTPTKLKNVHEIKNSDEKVELYMSQNPIDTSVVRKDKGKLPYSVFKATADKVTFIQSIYKKRPPTIFFHYPKYVGVAKEVQEKRLRSYNREDLQ